MTDLELVKERVIKINNTNIRDSAHFNVNLIGFKRLAITFGGAYAGQIIAKMSIKVSQSAWDNHPYEIEQYINIACDKLISDYLVVRRELGRDGSRSKEFMLSHAHVYGFEVE